MTNASTRFFVDTNVIAYAYDESDDERRERALAVLERLRPARLGVISTQVLGELFRALTRPRGIGMSPGLAEERVLGYARSWPILDVKQLHVVEALRGVREHKLSYYDALIWATARLNGLTYVLTEDGQDGRDLDGVRLVNPLREDFDLAWLR